MRNNFLLNFFLIAIALIIIGTAFGYFNWFTSYYPKYFEKKHSELFTNTEKNVKSLQESNYTSQSPTERTGQIGDTFGGTLGPVIAIVAAVLTFLAFWVQLGANLQQRNYIRDQRFEDTFFRLIDTHERMVDAIDLRDDKDMTRVKATARETYKYMFVELQKIVGTNTDITAIKGAYNKTQETFKHDLHHYFRFVYHVLKFIKNSDISKKEKYKYSSMFRAMFSAHELAMLFYNGLHPFGEKLRPLLEEFSFLKNIDDSLVLNDDLWKEYDPLVRADSGERPKLYIAWHEKQKRKKKRFGFSFYFDY